jgi:ABC-2 type transport system ATP-binding protein
MRSIEVRGLRKDYAFNRPALIEATFRYEGAGAIGYLGPNGAGKTTTLKLLTHLLLPTAGSALVNGIDVRHDPKHALADVGAVIETPEPYPSQTVAEAVEMAAQFRRGRTDHVGEEIARLNEELELPPLEQRCGRLSKGQRQRVVIAASLVRDPGVIILDEPTNGLDPKERILVRNLLNRLKRDHLILMSSHLMQEVTEICDQVIFINQGRIVLRDTVENVSSRFRTRAVDAVFATPVELARIRALTPLVQGAEFVAERRVRLTFDGSDPTRAAILAELVKLGPVLSYESASLMLEDAYLTLVGGTLAPPTAA